MKEIDPSMQQSYLPILFLFLIFGCKSHTPSRIEYVLLKSKVFENERSLRVYLPPTYDGLTSFKVLYLNDGQNLFGDHSSDADVEWRIDEIMDSLILNNSIEPLIIVGIDHAGKDRSNEYLPWEDIYLDPPLPRPEGKKYPALITEEVMPLIEQKYNVKQGSHNTGIGGASYGSLISLYTILQAPDVFGFALLESPSLYVHEQALLTLADSLRPHWPERMYMGIGTNEMALEDCAEDNADNQMAVKDVQDLAIIIKQQSPQTKLKVCIDSCAIHHEIAWSNRFPEAIQFLLKE